MDEENKLDEFLNRYKLPLGMGLVGLVLLIGGVVSSGLIPKTFIGSTTPGLKSTKFPSPSFAGAPESYASAMVAVDISGAIKNPGVYRLSSGSRVEEAVKMAGGVTDFADPIYINKNLNLAQKLSDGMKIYIPAAGEAGSSAALGTAVGTNQSGPLNINNASLGQLDTLSGIGEVTAQKIIDNRPYGSIEELLIKKAVTRSVYEKIKDRVSVY